MKKAIITGISGQDGSYLSELLLSKGYDVYGFVRRESFENSSERLKNLKNILSEIKLVPISITDSLSIHKAISKIMPDELYHLAAQSFVSYDMTDEINIMNINFNSTLYIANTIKEVIPGCRMFFAGSSEMFGNPEISPQAEGAKFNPKSIYGIAKVSSYYLLKNYRSNCNMFFSTGIMYNHESSRRGNQFVTKKVISTAVKIKLGELKKLELGNLEAYRDWGYAPDYVNAMWMILQQDISEDYVIATGKLHSVRELVRIVFNYLRMDYKEHVLVDKKFYRPSEKIPLSGNCEKLKSIGWRHSKTFHEIIKEMIDEEIKNMKA